MTRESASGWVVADFLHPELTKAGYMGIYKRKTAEIFTGSQYTIDGCATFFK